MRTKFIKFRVSKIEDRIIKINAKKAGLTVSEFLRRSALDLELKHRLTEEEIQCYKNLSKFSNNFRSISNYLKAGDVTKVKEISLETSRLIREHLNKLKS